MNCLNLVLKSLTQECISVRLKNIDEHAYDVVLIILVRGDKHAEWDDFDDRKNGWHISNSRHLIDSLGTLRNCNNESDKDTSIKSGKYGR